MLELSIVVCTYERPQRLARALDAILATEGLADAAVELIVVDNSEGETARAVVERAATRSSAPVRFVPARPANIAVARNAGAAAARGRFVAFLDDDQEVGPGWLETILRAAQTHPHDVFLPAVRSRFDDADSANSGRAAAMFSKRWARYGTSRLFGVSSPSCLGPGHSCVHGARRRSRARAVRPGFGSRGWRDFSCSSSLERRGRGSPGSRAR